jgi:hypothetical protein
MNAGRVPILEPKIERRRNLLAGFTGHRVERAVDGRVDPFVGRAQRERQRLIRRGLDELLGLALVIEVAFQTPALEPGAAVRENGDDAARLDANVALAGLADQRGGGRRHGRGRSRRRRRWCRRARTSGRGWGLRYSGNRSGCAGRWLGRWFDEQRLPDVQDQERQKDGQEDAAFHLQRHRVVPCGAQGMTANQSARREPTSPENAVPRDGHGGVIRAGRQKAARATKKWRKRELVDAERSQGQADGNRGSSAVAVVGCHARRDLGIRLQERSGWRRAGRGWE